MAEAIFIRKNVLCGFTEEDGDRCKEKVTFYDKPTELDNTYTVICPVHGDITNL